MMGNRETDMDEHTTTITVTSKHLDAAIAGYDRHSVCNTCLLAVALNANTGKAHSVGFAKAWRNENGHTVEVQLPQKAADLITLFDRQMNNSTPNFDQIRSLLPVTFDVEELS
jgi:hypothetical protein